MRVAVAVPQRPGTTSGNSVTGDRWVRRLRELGHEASLVSIPDDRAEPVDVGELDVLVALHATRCAAAVRRASEDRPELPIVVGLAGTDLYRDLPDNEQTRTTIGVADRLVVLQDDAIGRLHDIDPTFSTKADIVHQSVEHDHRVRRQPGDGGLTVVVLAHLRDVKDPLLAAHAVASLPADADVRVEHAGAAYTAAWGDRARLEASRNERYTWHGPLDRTRARELLSRGDVVACTSTLEGGANAVSEAIASGIAVVGTDIGGNRGLLGSDHPGLVSVGDVAALARLIGTLTSEHRQARCGRLVGGGLLERLARRSLERTWMTEPSHERDQWKAVLAAALP